MPAGINLIWTRDARLSEIHKKVQQYPARYAAFLKNHYNKKKFLKDDDNRVAFVKILLADIANHYHLFEKLLANDKTDVDFEVHFSIFVFVDWMARLPIDKSISQKVFDRVVEYVHHGKKHTGQAVWMAGDFLGDHWHDRNESFAALK